MKKKITTTSDHKRLVAAGWKPRKGGLWKSPYSGAVHGEEKAVRTELLIEQCGNDPSKL